MANEVISIIIPVYKAEKYLDRCLNSVLNQTFRDLEVILIDDGSPDRSPQLCDEWALKDPRIKVIHKENGGPSSARNAGLNEATGAYIGYVDSDDWILPMMFETLYSAIQRYDAEFAECELQICKSEEDPIIQPELKETVMDNREIMETFFRVKSQDIPYCTCGKLCKKEMLEGIRFWEGMRFEDIDYNYWISINCNKGVHINQIYYCWFYNVGSITRAGLIPEDMQLIKIWNRIRKDCKKNHPQYAYYAEMNYERAFMGLLAKGCKFGVSENYTNWPADRAYLLKNLRRFYKRLLKWKMPKSRKLLLTALCVNPAIVSLPFEVRNAITKAKE